MNALQREIETYRDTWIKLGIDCYTEHYPGKEDEPYRAYLTSRVLGGTLAVNNGEGWIPTYPEKPNYPMKGRWYSPGRAHFTPSTWEFSMFCALDPKNYLTLFQPHIAEEMAKERAAMLRDPFRAQVVIAMIKGLANE